MRNTIQYAVYLIIIMMMGMVAAGCRHHSSADDMPEGDCMLVIAVPTPDYAPYSETRSIPMTQRKIRIRLESDGKVMDYQTITDKDTVEVSFKLEYGEYKAYIWSDEDLSERINTDDLPYVSISLPDKYSCSLHAAAANVFFNINSPSIRCSAELKYPFAKIRFITTDTSNTGYEDLTASVHYDGFLPTMFNIATFSPCNAATGYSFSCPITTEVIAEDHIFAGEKESFVRVDVTVKDRSGEIVANTSNLKVPYRRGCVTTVTGDFLTPKPQGDSGITLDTNWSGEYEIEF